MADGCGTANEQRRSLDFPGIAQEFLRRNPAYRRDYHGVMSNPQAGTAAQEVMALQWGLRFPGRSVSARGRFAGDLVRRPLR